METVNHKRVVPVGGIEHELQRRRRQLGRHRDGECHIGGLPRLQCRDYLRGRLVYHETEKVGQHKRKGWCCLTALVDDVTGDGR